MSGRNGHVFVRFWRDVVETSNSDRLSTIVAGVVSRVEVDLTADVLGQSSLVLVRELVAGGNQRNVVSLGVGMMRRSAP